MGGRIYTKARAHPAREEKRKRKKHVSGDCRGAKEESWLSNVSRFRRRRLGRAPARPRGRGLPEECRRWPRRTRWRSRPAGASRCGSGGTKVLGCGSVFTTTKVRSFVNTDRASLGHTSKRIVTLSPGPPVFTTSRRTGLM